ncbi:MAG: peptide deformylase [Treponema sp.]|nr:peptide deformylase [Treponema sp.]
MILDIVKLGEESLREKSVAVEEVNDEIKQLANDMFETMIEADGVGLAAPQIGRNIRMFVVIADDDIRRVFINPQIIKTSEEVGPYDEGCLSIPQVYESIIRPLKVTVQALNENGKPFTLDADGLLARVIQHEYDHLEGIVFIDRGDKAFAEKTEQAFQKRAERAAKKAQEKAAKKARLNAKLAAKEAKKNK